MRVGLKILNLSMAIALMPAFGCSKDKSDDTNCEAMISDINSAVSAHFSGLSIFECTNAADCSTTKYQTSCYTGCNTNVLTTRKEELSTFLAGSEIAAICSGYQAKGCLAIVDDCPG